MALITLNHLATRSVSDATVLLNIKNIDELTHAAIIYGEKNAKAAGTLGSIEYEQAYNTRVGEVFEVYAEFFLK